MKVGDVTVCKKDFGQFAKKDEIFIIKYLHQTAVEIAVNIYDKKSFTILNSYFPEYFMSAGEYREYRINQILE